MKEWICTDCEFAPCYESLPEKPYICTKKKNKKPRFKLNED